MSAPGYTGPILNYFNGAGAQPTGMPAGTNNQNAFVNGTQGQYLTGSLGRRGAAVYSNLSSALGANFIIRLNVPGLVAAPGWMGPQPALFPNRNGFNSATINRPY
jgi:hypothetical protein